MGGCHWEGALRVSTGRIRRALVHLTATACLACDGEPPAASALARDSLGIRLLEATQGGEHLGLSLIPFRTDLPDFGDIRDVALASDGHVVVLDPLGPFVVVLDPSGAERSRFGKDGEGPGEFRAAGLTSVVIAGDTVIVPDAFNQRVTLFDLDGRVLGEFPLRSDAGFTLDWHLGPDGSLVYRRMSYPQRLEVVDMLGSNRRVLRDLTELSLPSEPGPLTPLPVWCILHDGQLASARTDRYSVTVADDSAASAILSGDVGDRPFGDAELAQLYELARQSLAQRLQAEVDLAFARDLVRQMHLPASAPLIAGLVCSETGEVWVQHALPVGQMGPNVTRVGSSEAWRSSVWDVFRVDDSRVYRVELPDGAQITRVTEDMAVGYVVGQLDQKTPARWSRE